VKDKLVIDSLDAVKALSDSRRLELLKLLVVQSMTAADLADEIGEAKSKLYYHLGELEKAGLIEVVETRRKRNFMEKVYRATASYFSIDRSLFQAERGMEALLSTVGSILDTTSADIHRLVDSGAIDGESSDMLFHAHRRLVMTDERYDEFKQRLTELLEEFGDEEHGEGDAYALTYVMYPQPD
jgi:DNA-binding transcriptional ArsR family regulator